MIYDVTLPLSPELAVWPGDPPISRETIGDRVKISRWTLGSHAGTHVDAPAHFSAGTRTVDLLDPNVLLGPCRVIDLPDMPTVTADVLAAHQLLGVERLLIRTRNSLHWRQDSSRVFDEYVGLNAAAAHLLVELGLKLCGIDGLTVGAAEDDEEVHETLLGAGVVLLEGLNLAGVPAGDYQVICAPLKLVGGDGAPARVFLTR